MSTKRTQSKIASLEKQNKRENQRFLRNSRRRQGVVELARNRRSQLVHMLGGELLKLDPLEIANLALRKLLIEVRAELDAIDRELEAAGLKPGNRRAKAVPPDAAQAETETSQKPPPKPMIVSVTVGFTSPPSGKLRARLKEIRLKYHSDEMVWRGRADPDVVMGMIHAENCGDLIRLFEPSG